MRVVRVPATTANLGSGFDTLGMALDLFMDVKFEVLESTDECKIEINGYGETSLPKDSSNLIYQSYRSVFEKLNKKVTGISLNVFNDIPVSRGLGSSASAIVSGVTIANIVLGNVLKIDEIIDLCTKIEGHPDNVVPCVVGGFTVSKIIDGKVIYKKLDGITDLGYYLLVPKYRLETKISREILPELIWFNDCILNISSCALLTSAFATNDISLVKYALDDMLHEPFRGKLIKGFSFIKENYLKYNFLGTTISGSGPSVVIYYNKLEKILKSDFIDDLKKEHTFEFNLLDLNLCANGCIEVE